MNDLMVDRSPCWPVSAFHLCSSVPPAQRLPGNAIHIQIHSQPFFLAAIPHSPWLWTPSQTRPEVCFTDTGVPPSSQVHNHFNHHRTGLPQKPSVSRDWHEGCLTVRNATAFSDIGQPPVPARVCPGFSSHDFSFPAGFSGLPERSKPWNGREVTSLRAEGRVGELPSAAVWLW